MPKSRKARRNRSAPTATLLVLVGAALALGWWLLLPRSRPQVAHRVVRTVAAVPTPSPPPPLPSASAAIVSSTPTQSASPGSSSRQPSASPFPAPSSSAPAAAPGHAGAAKLALIVDDCGQWLNTERGFVALDVPLTLSVLPDVPYTATIAREAAGAGKGVMLHLPMETVSGLNPGPGKVTTEMTDAQIDAQVGEDLDQIPLARGVNNHEGSRGSADERVMHDVIGVLSKRGNLFFIDSKTSAASVGEAVARDGGVPTAGRDVFLDNVASVAYTERQLRAAAEIARRTGSAIAIGHPRPTTLAAVRDLIPQLQAEGIEFVLAQDLVGMKSP